MTPFPWYDMVGPGAPLDQGDLILGCPVADWSDAPSNPNLEEGSVDWLKGQIEFTRVDLVVMSQTCDLIHGKLRKVVLCPHLQLKHYRTTWDDARKQCGVASNEKAWTSHLETILKGRIWDLAMLNLGETESYTDQHRIVSLGDVLSLPREFLESWVGNHSTPRPRLLPPYREHLSQAFARFFMRVGLPTDITKNW